MKSKKVISLILILTVLFTLNSNFIFAEGTGTIPSTELNLSYNNANGSVSSTKGTSFVKELTCLESEHEHDGTSCDLSVKTCSDDNLHEHTDGCYNLSCSIMNHPAHTVDCYTNQLTCLLPIHDHSLINCWGLTCTEELHVHTGDCIGLVCTKEQHIHDLACTGLICTKRISWSHLFHGLDCYGLICNKEVHIHDDIINDCYDKVCGKHTHVHDPVGCHGWTCGITEHKSHAEACYSDVLTCGLELVSHDHIDSCYTKTCMIEEHAHSIEAGCYICSLSEHTHNIDSCYTWPTTSISVIANTGYYISDISGTGNTESIPDKAASYSTTILMDQDRTVSVAFEKFQYNVTGLSSNSTMGTVSGGGTVNYGDSADLTAIPAEGYRFVKWDDDNTDNPRTISNITSDITLTAVFEAIPQYTVTTATIGTGTGTVTVSPSAPPYYQGTNVRITATPDAGSHFVEWLVGDESVTANPYEANNLNGNISLTAQFDLNPERYLAAEFDEDLSVPGVTNAWNITNPSSTEEIICDWQINSGTHYSGSETLSPLETYSFTTNVESNPDELTVRWTDSFGETADENAWAKRFVEVNVSTANGNIVEDGVGGSVLNGGTHYFFEGKTLRLVAQPSPGYRFVRWDINPAEGLTIRYLGNILEIDLFMDYSESASTEMTLMKTEILGLPLMDGISINAIFKLISSPPPPPPAQTYYNLNISVEGPGKVNAPSGSLVSGSTVSMSPVPDDGAEFVGWFGANGAEVSSNSIVMTGNKSVIARFENIVAVIEDDDTPSGGEVKDEDDGSKGDSPEVLLDNPVPLADTTLPKTGGIPIELVIGAGFALTAGGLSMRKKEEKK